MPSFNQYGQLLGGLHAANASDAASFAWSRPAQASAGQHTAWSMIGRKPSASGGANLSMSAFNRWSAPTVLGWHGEGTPAT